ncbi:MAG: dTDP-glucose 4,6-dehydratase [Parcubacteria group bacterium GW2011_GWA2_42_11]|nr:MAG: dTDP-glucose 4,6-dehydratase [Parcubacteria group bacterium GW2011_GWA2_42_11]
MKILITGGAGFMGSNIIHYLLEKYPDYEIINLDKLTYAGNLDNLKDVEKNPQYKFIKGDIAKSDDVKKAIGSGVDLIINYAAETHVDRSILEPDAFIKTDIFGTYNLLEAVRAGLAKKMVQISTDEVFGMVHEMGDEFTEESKFDPSSPYSASKAGGDHLCSAYFKTYGTPVIVTHSCNFYGPNQYPEKLIPLAITNLIEGKKVPVYGAGDQFREWIFTADHCRAVDLIAHNGKVGEIYNIGTRERRKNIETVKIILDSLDKDESGIEYVKDRPGHDFGYAVNPDKLINELGWQPQIDFENGLRETVAWYRNNEAWWKKIKSGEYLEYYKKQYGH